jgi:hypothetical protein
LSERKDTTSPAWIPPGQPCSDASSLAQSAWGVSDGLCNRS